MTYVLPFDYKLAFFGTTDKQYAGTIQNPAPLINPAYSKCIAYIYLAMTVGKTANVHVPDPQLIKVLQLVLPDYSFVSKVSEGIEFFDVVSIDVSGNDELEYQGFLMKPVYVDPESTTLYLLRDTSLPNQKIPCDYLRNSLRYFNQVIRNKSSGGGAVIWRDPITMQTKLDEGYDELFCYYVLEKCIACIDRAYDREGDLELILAKTIALHQELLALLAPPAVIAPTQQTLKEFSIGARVYKALPAGQEYGYDDRATVAVESHPQKRIITDILYFLARAGVTRESADTFIYTRYESYKFLSVMKELLPNAHHVVYEHRVKGTESHAEAFTDQQAKQYSKDKVFFLAGRVITDKIIQSLRAQAALLPYSIQSRLQKDIIFASNYVGANNTTAVNMIVMAPQERGPSPKTIAFVKWYSYTWRNTLTWSYTDPITQAPASYDEASLSALLLNYHKTANLATPIVEFRDQVLAML